MSNIFEIYDYEDRNNEANYQLDGRIRGGKLHRREDDISAEAPAIY